MLTHPGSGVYDLAAELDCAEDDVRNALDQLARLSLLRPSWEDPETLRPVRPDIAVNTLLAHQEADLVRRQAEIVENRAKAALFSADHARSIAAEAHTDIEELHGIDAIRDRLEFLTRRTTREVLSLMPDGAQTAANMEASRDLDAELLGRGVAVLTIYLDSVRNDGPTTAYAMWLSDLGGAVRTLPTLPIRMIVFDRELAVIPADPDNSSAGALLIRGQATVMALSAFFDQLWSGAQPLGTVARRDDHGLTGQERDLLRLLAQGDTDTIVARKLGVSPRTARRITADLMERLGARSRFQAGARATERGWLA
ncbi:LuxR C-terminal-related transcriptional regulator [Streptomyces sp. NPDC059618]|uniref:LuxR C-terminal-related transcriptional regulator n=1 Tax=Streptomyces sp. NPDC059618 TaxID=3346887 RepID=UPI00369CBF93